MTNEHLQMIYSIIIVLILIALIRVKAEKKVTVYDKMYVTRTYSRFKNGWRWKLQMRMDELKRFTDPGNNDSGIHSDEDWGRLPTEDEGLERMNYN